MKHEYDKRYQDSQIRQRIAAMYFPFVITVCSPAQKLNRYKEESHFNLHIVSFQLTDATGQVVLKQADRSIFSPTSL